MMRALGPTMILYTLAATAVVAWLYGRWAWESRHSPRPLWYAVAGIALATAGYSVYAPMALIHEIERAWPDMPIFGAIEQREAIWVFRAAILCGAWALVCGYIGETKSGAAYKRWHRRWRRWALAALALFPAVWWAFSRLGP